MTAKASGRPGKPMTHRERALAVLRYQPYDRLPLVHFGYWGETLHNWVAQGHLKQEDIDGCGDGNAVDDALAAKIGFDFNWNHTIGGNHGIIPGMEGAVVAEFPDGTKHVRDGCGVTHVQRPGAGSIPAEVDHLLKDRASWEEHFKWRLQWSPERVNVEHIKQVTEVERDTPLGIYCGSLYGSIRGMMGFEGTCYMLADDEPLFDEIIQTIGEVSYLNVKTILESGAKFDFGHYWEDICFKNGPLVSPKVFWEKVGPQYNRINDMLTQHGIDVVSLDCDGCVDALVPTWIENGVNTMFPIEVGTWGSSIGPWREKYGKRLLGVGGMNKTLFAHDRAAIDGEVERLKPLVELGGFIPCPDHRIAPDAKFELVCYYCERMREVFG